MQTPSKAEADEGAATAAVVVAVVAAVPPLAVVEQDARLSLVAAQVEEDARLPMVAEMVVNDAVMGIAVMVGLPVEEDAQALAVAGDVVMGMAGMEEMDHGDTDSDTPFKAAQRRS